MQFSINLYWKSPLLNVLHLTFDFFDFFFYPFIRFVHVPLLCSDGVQALACASKRQRSVRPAVKWKTFVRRVCSTWSMVSLWHPIFALQLHCYLLTTLNNSSPCRAKPPCSLCFIGLPIQVRDTGLAVKEDIPRSDVNKEYYTQNMEREVSRLYIFIFTCTVN